MDTKLQQAISAIKAGNEKAGQRLLAQIIKADPKNEVAWLWMSTALDDSQKKKQCLQRVLQINPANETARKGLAQLETSTVKTPRLEDIVPQPSVATKPKPQKNARPVPRSAAYALGKAIGRASKPEDTAEKTTQETKENDKKTSRNLEKVLLIFLGFCLLSIVISIRALTSEPSSRTVQPQKTVTTEYGIFTYPGGTGYIDGRDVEADPPLTIMNVNLWSSTDTSHRRVCQIPHGTQVNILDVKNDDGWYYFQVQNGSCKGWLSWWFVNTARYEPVGERFYN